MPDEQPSNQPSPSTGGEQGGGQSTPPPPPPPKIVLNPDYETRGADPDTTKKK